MSVSARDRAASGAGTEPQLAALAQSLAAALACVVEADAAESGSEAYVGTAADPVAELFLIAAGGTGGHVLPAVETARELARRGHECIFVGAGRGMEERLTAKAGFPIELIPIGPLNRVSLARRLRTLAALPLAAFRAWRLLGRLRPAAVLSVGGYASGPVALAAVLRGVPLVALEPNAYPGLANRLAARFVARALTGFPEANRYFPEGRAETIGTPVREEFFNSVNKKHSETFMILVTGGSQGSRTLNRACAEAARIWAKDGTAAGVTLLHQTGRDQCHEARSEYELLRERTGFDAQAVEFIDDMPAAFARADLVISRSGASTAAELAAAGKPSVLIPFPFAADDHQAKNAAALAAAGAALVVPDAEWTGERMVSEIEQLRRTPDALESMARAARGVARPDAAKRAADVMEQAALRTDVEGRRR